MMLKGKSYGLCIALILCVCSVFSQKKIFQGDPDVAFEKARELAFNKQRKEAQDTLRFILTKYPNYLDVRSFLASTYSWDGNYKQARTEFEYILKKDAKRKNDWVATINNELYAELPYKAYELVKKALLYFPDDTDLLYLKAKSEEKFQKPEDALRTLDKIIEIDSNNNKAISYKESLMNTLRFNSVGLNYSMILYNKDERDPSYYSTVRYSRQTKYGSIIAKVNYSRRFDTNNFQYEIDMYPRIVEGLYAYISGGFSNDALFPEIRYGAELYKTLPYSLEVSLGFRGLKFSETTTIYTGSIGWYTGNSYWSFRTYITPNDNGTSKSGTLTYRKYYSDADNYFGIAVGVGFSPEIDRFPVNTEQVVIFDLKTQKVSGEYAFTSSNKKHAWKTFVNILREEKSFDRGKYFLLYTVGVAYDIRFR
ncbi:YaiO family outer membrane beta-barrel protein [Tenacibaculum caenipelagi]|nr:YaiO family outer membrane beta-barrel protein [Tenacibaculum caenipelagi]